MGRRCLICCHPKRDEIDRELLKGVPFREISAHHESEGHHLDKSGLFRHKQFHLSRALVRSKEAEEAIRGESLWDQIQ
jgi:hypothetical protein